MIDTAFEIASKTSKQITYKTLELSFASTKTKKKQPAPYIQQTEKTIQTKEAMYA
jgi:hypothetical protein